MSQNTVEITFLVLFTLTVICGFSLVAMTLYLGRRHVKEVDRAVWGHELSTDIITLFARAPAYAAGFAWRLFARRNGLAGKIEHFDRKFQRPFIITFWLMVVSGGLMILSIAIHRLLLDGG